jgi:predicted alpha/beta superfamily hydrolase
MRRAVWLWLILAGAVWALPEDVPVTFSNRLSTTVGQSVFVLGNLPQLGGWVRNRAIKLVPSNCSGSTCDWSATIALPPGVNYEYKFVKRYDCACCWDIPNISCYGRTDDASIEYEPGPNRTGATPALPPAPYPGKTVFYYSGWASVSILYSNTFTGQFVAQPMLPVSNGLWRADNLNRAGETNLFFVFTDNQGNYDNPDFVPGRNYSTPLDACVVRQGQIFNYWPPAFVSTNRVETFFITPTNGLAGRTIRVYLPRGYNENVHKRYPVLYMHDGQNLFLGMTPFPGGSSWNVDTNVNNLIRYGKMRETIVVGIDNADRQCEFTPCPLSVCAGSVATAEKYTQFVIRELKPVIDATYRTLPDAENTGVMGSSRGGLISTYMAWEYPDVFRKVGIVSPSYWACATTMNNLANSPKRPLRIYMDTGTVGDFPVSNPPCNPCYDGLVQTVTARDNLLKNGYVVNDDFDFVFGFGHDHTEYWWDRRSPRAYTFLFPTSDEPNTVLASAAPARITDFRAAGESNVVTWTSYRRRVYSVEGVTNHSFSAGMTWSNLVTLPVELLPWSYPSVGVTNSFRFLRVREHAVPHWPE